MSFVSGRRFQSLSKSEGESKKKNNSARKRESKKSKEQRQDKKQSKTEQKFSFCRQREIVVVSRPPLYCRLLIINYGKPRSTHKSCLSFYTKNGQNTFIWRARRERSNARLARSSVGVAVVVAARRRLLWDLLLRLHHHSLLSRGGMCPRHHQHRRRQQRLLKRLPHWWRISTSTGGLR